MTTLSLFRDIALMEAAAREVIERRRAEAHQRDRDVLYWLGTNAKILTQEALMVWQELPWHSRVLEELTGRDVIVKSRDVGSSSFWVGVRLHDVLVNPPGIVLIAADRGDNATNLVDYARTILENLPPTTVKMLKDNTTELEFTSRNAEGQWRRSSIQAITATPRSGRSYRCRHLICTEMGFWVDSRKYWAAVSGAVAAGGTIVCESTWPEDGAATYYGQLWEKPAMGFRRHFIGRSEVPWHDTAWEVRRRMELTAADFQREHPETPEEAIGAPAEGAFSVFSKEALRRAHDLLEDMVPEEMQVELGPPEQHHHYVTFWDLGQSKGRGATVGVTLDVTRPLHFIRMFQRYEELPWPLVQMAIEDTSRSFPGETFVEVNGPGDPVIANLRVAVNPFLTTQSSKTYAIKHTATRMEQGWLKWPTGQEDYENLAQLDLELQLYEWKDQNLVQDSVIALCGAEYCAGAGAAAFMR